MSNRLKWVTFRRYNGRELTVLLDTVLGVEHVPALCGLQLKLMGQQYPEQIDHSIVDFKTLMAEAYEQT